MCEKYKWVCIAKDVGGEQKETIHKYANKLQYVFNMTWIPSDYRYPYNWLRPTLFCRPWITRNAQNYALKITINHAINVPYYSLPYIHYSLPITQLPVGVNDDCEQWPDCFCHQTRAHTHTHKTDTNNHPWTNQPQYVRQQCHRINSINKQCAQLSLASGGLLLRAHRPLQRRRLTHVLSNDANTGQCIPQQKHYVFIVRDRLGRQ